MVKVRVANMAYKTQRHGRQKPHERVAEKVRKTMKGRAVRRGVAKVRESNKLARTSRFSR